jgi:outer membrane protein assembly factor BamB
MCPQKKQPLPWLALLILSVLVLAVPLWAENTNAVNELWRLKLPETASQSSCAIAPDGTIYQGTFSGWFAAITPEGQVKWKYKAGLEIWSSPGLADDGTIYFGSRDRNLYALTPEGKLKWKFATGAWVDSSPAIAPDGTVYFGSWDNNFYALTPDGKLKWKFATSNLITSSPALAADGTVYFGSHDKNLYALNPDGKLKWSFPTGAEIDGSPTIAADGTVYIGSTDGNLYALHPDGSELWRLHTGGYTASSPVLDEAGNLYLGATKDQIAVSRDGKLIWQHPTEVALDMSWAVAANGMVYVSMPWLAISAMDRHHPWPPPWYAYMQFNLCSAPNLNPEGIIYACDGPWLYALKPVDAAPLVKSSWPVWRGNPQHNGRAQKTD